jgi:hypothetical protein
LSSGQVQFAITRFSLKRNRVTFSTLHKNSLLNRMHNTKKCNHCQENYKPNSGRQKFCVLCAPNKSFIRRIHNYKIGKREFDKILSHQNNKCGICFSLLNDLSASVDHCHITNKVRGLLCRQCNLKLFVIEDNIYVTNAISYLKNIKRN